MTAPSQIHNRHLLAAGDALLPRVTVPVFTSSGCGFQGGLIPNVA
jgi:hypothetical protein